MATAESNLMEVRAAFETFRQESTKQSQKSLKKLEEVSGQIKAFQDMSDGKVTGVLNENENLKVKKWFYFIPYCVTEDISNWWPYCMTGRRSVERRLTSSGQNPPDMCIDSKEVVLLFRHWATRLFDLISY